MKKRMKKRLIALICMISMLCSMCWSAVPALAEDSTSEDITLETAPEKDFSHWTFSDVGITNADYTSIWDTNKSYTNGKSLDKTIFHGKINFPTESFGNFYIGDVDPSTDSFWRGFLFSVNGEDSLNFGFVGTSGFFYDATGKTTNNQNGYLATFDPDTAGATLRGNKDLKVSFSVEYTSVTDDNLVTMKVGVFFNGKLYDNTYYTVKDVPVGFLTQTIRLSEGANAVGMKSVLAEDITLETAPESKFAHWTFSDVGLVDKEYTNIWNANNMPWYNDKSLDKTIFHGKINFPTTSFGNFYIGGGGTNSIWRGFVFTGSETDKISFGFIGDNGYFYNENGSTGSETASYLATFDPTVAGTTLRDNKDLKVSFSVEYTSEADGLVTMKVGVFFDGRLYDNTYYTVKDVPESLLIQSIRCTSGPLTIGSVNIMLETAPESKFAHWTFSDVGLADNTYTNIWNANSMPWYNDKSLDKTIFQGKINFPTTSFGNFYIGGGGTNSIWRGFVFTGSETDKISFGFIGDNGYFLFKNQVSSGLSP